MAVTLKDIAALAGVSVGTVDRALNNRGRVRPEVAERIRTIAKQMNYHTNSIAKSLALRNRNLKIGLVLHIHGNDFFNEVLTGVQQGQIEIMDFGFQVEIYRCKDFDAQEQCRLIDLAIEEGANAILLVPINDPAIKEKLHKLKEANIPVVLLSAHLSGAPVLSAVHCNYTRSGRIGGRLIDLISGGKARILIFTPSLHMFGHRQRLEGLNSYISQKAHDLHVCDVITISTDTIDAYRAAMDAIAKYPDADFALFCGNTKAWLRAVADSGRNITTVVYDEAPSTREALLEGKIAAAILQEPAQQGYQAVMTLFHYFLYDTTPEQEILVDNRIILKECID